MDMARYLRGAAMHTACTAWQLPFPCATVVFSLVYACFLARLRQLPLGAALSCFFFVRHHWVARRTVTACEQLGTERRQICLHNETVILIVLP